MTASADPDVTQLREHLARYWDIRSAEVEPLGGGMNSATWLVRHAGSAYVAKHVPPARVGDLEAGCQVASALADRGIVTGRPVPTADGRLVVTEHALALLERVPGRELRGESAEEQRRIAAILADVHAAGGPDEGPSTATFATEWLTPNLPGVAAHPWLRPVLEAVRAETDPLCVTWSMLHTDPAPEAFIHDDSTGVTGLIDWTGAARGPVLYDVASVVMYLGGPDDASAFLDAYRSRGVLTAGEWQWLDAFSRFRWAVQAAYFAWRLAAHDLTGLADQSGNEKGLSDARRGLARLGHDVA